MRKAGTAAYKTVELGMIGCLILFKYNNMDLGAMIGLSILGISLVLFERAPGDVDL